MEELTHEELLEKRVFLRKQISPLIVGACPNVQCRCGIRVPLWMTFRCYYCGEFFCRACAAEHFGKRMSESASRDEARLVRELRPIHIGLNARLRDKEARVCSARR